ncbi:MAG TPA: TSUP family transporter [Nakamurella sp.]|jgi:uncharacterized membrane protein YfcA|nr:TSUP family transporter [Nakamurella sp.]
MVAVAVGVLGGAAVTRLTGLGFALVASPFLVVLLGPFDGVLLCNLLTMLAAAAMLATHWRHVQWRRAALLLVPAVLVIPAGALLVHRLPPAPLSVLIGSALLIAVGLVARGRSSRALTGTPGTLLAGAGSAGLNVLAGVGGPILALYGVTQRWTGRSFLATVPVCSLVFNALSLATKGFPRVTGTELAVVVSALVVGSVAGEVLVRRIGSRHAQPVLLTVSAVGAVAAIVKGALAW